MFYKGKRMSHTKNKLYLFEAIERLCEYEERIKILQEILPESFVIDNDYMDDETLKFLPVSDFDVPKVRERIHELQNKQRKLYNAIQQTNHNHTINFHNETMTLAEALHLRKTTQKRIGTLQKELKTSGYVAVLYKDERDIKDLPVSYKETDKILELKYLLFRELNIKLRKISFEVTIDFSDEH